VKLPRLRALACLSPKRVAHALKRLVEAMMKYERDEFLACGSHQRTPKRRGYRNGYERRTFDSRFGGRFRPAG
jgi:transposase-like protein